MSTLPAKEDLKRYIRYNVHCIATFGDASVACSSLTNWLQELGKAFAVLETKSLAPLPRLYDYQGRHSKIASDHPATPPLIEAFLAVNGVTQIPDVLILNKFNSVDKVVTYYLKGLLLDEVARVLSDNIGAEHRIFQKLKLVVLTCDKGAPPMDDVLSGCIGAVIDL